MIKTNYHTHTIFCDGNNTIEELVQTAIQKGFSHLGFSGHSMYPFASTWHISPKQMEEYCTQVRQAAQKYSEKISILLGFEADFCPAISEPSFSTYKKFSPDFLIGSVHYVFTKNGRLAVDYSAEKLSQKIKELFNGNSKKLVCEYFYLQREMLAKSDFTIIAHPDLIRKNNAKLNLFNESETWYRKELKATAKAIAKAGVIAEINTGAIARKTMNSPYPSSEFLSLLRMNNVPITINSDCHNATDLDTGFTIAKKMAIKAGYSEVAYLCCNNKKTEIHFQNICELPF